MANKVKKQKAKRPKTLEDFEKYFPDVWKAYLGLRESCDHQDGLDLKTRALSLPLVGMPTVLEAFRVAQQTLK